MKFEKMHHKVFLKTNFGHGIRTRTVCTEGLDCLQYAIKSFGTRKSILIINFLSINENVIYFAIYEKLMLSRKLQFNG